MLVSHAIVDIAGNFFAWLGICVCTFGIFTNIINIVVFIRQGSKDRTNTSLLGLAVSDLLSLVTQTWALFCFTDLFSVLDLPFSPKDTTYLIAGWPRLVFTRATTWITAYISLEKCLCVVAPLKVQNLFTRRRTMAYIILVYLLAFASISPVYYTTRFAWVSNSATNKTILSTAFIENRNDFEISSFYINNIIPTAAFVIIICCTVILISEIKRRFQWRKKSAKSTNARAISQRDLKLIKMVTCLSGVFILCYTPGTLLFVWMLLDSELRIDGGERNLFLLFHSCLYIIEAVNASTSLLVYLTMSSKFLQVFKELFPFVNRCIKNTKQEKTNL